jgi:lysophospholipase L1-like esterase
MSASSSGGRGGLPIIPVALVAALVAGGGWLWYESLPRPAAEIPARAEEGPVRMRLLGSDATEVDPANPPTGGGDSPMLREKARAAREALDREQEGAAGEASEAPGNRTPAQDAPAQDAPAEGPGAEGSPAAAPSEGAGVGDAGRWEEEIARYEAADRAAPPIPGGVLFLGSSNVRMWDSLADDFSGIAVVNRGVGGCRLAELADFAPRLTRPAEPAVIVVSAGTNDIHSGADPAEVEEAFRRLAAVVRRDHPGAALVYLAILPAPSRLGERERQVRANELVRGAVEALSAEGARVAYLDAGDAFLTPAGTPDPEAFLEDDLHPGPLGNARRAALVRPLLERLLDPARPPA